MDVKIERPLLPLRDIVVFPNMVIPLFVGRDKSISALNEVMKKDKKIILVTQRNSEIDDPKKTGGRGLRSILENILLKTMYDLPSQENVEEVIVDASAAKGQTQPIIVHSKNANKIKNDKSSVA